MSTGARDDVPIRDAATVVLLRDSPSGHGVETWLLTRVVQMAFAAGMSVFPGGRVDEADADLPFSGSSITEIATRFGYDETGARAVAGAAVRELFEEAGVLLTTPAADLSGERAAVEAGHQSFGTLLREHGLAIDSDALRPWARWITPAGESRRYDTHFFVAALPDGAHAQDVTTESSIAGWVGIGEALEQAQRGERILMPPTLRTLSALVGFGSVAEALAAATTRPIEAVNPTLRVADSGEHFVDLPDGTSVPLPRRNR